MKDFFVGLIVTAFVMAIAWTLMDMGALQGFSEDFFGKVIVSAVIVLISKILSAMLGGKSS